MRSGFARLHPLVDLTFFVLVLAFAMFLSHPAVQLAGLVCAALFALRCTGRGFGRRMAMLLPLLLLAAVGTVAGRLLWKRRRRERQAASKESENKP